MEIPIIESSVIESDDCIVNLLHSLKLRPQKIDASIYAFDSDCFSLLYFPPSENKKSFTIAIPRIYNTETFPNKSVMTSLVNHVNNLIPAVKLSVIDNEVWAVYENIEFTSDVSASVVNKIIEQLKDAVCLFQTLVSMGSGNENT